MIPTTKNKIKEQLVKGSEKKVDHRRSNIFYFELNHCLVESQPVKIYEMKLCMLAVGINGQDKKKLCRRQTFFLPRVG